MKRAGFTASAWFKAEGSLSNMLGANQPGITLAMSALAAAGLVHHARGQITVPDRIGLEAAAGGSYGVPEAEYAHLFGPPR